MSMKKQSQDMTIGIYTVIARFMGDGNKHNVFQIADSPLDL